MNVGDLALSPEAVAVLARLGEPYGQVLDKWPAAPPVAGRSRAERLYRWLLRLLPPVALGLCGQLIFWMWFDDIDSASAWSTAGGLPVAIAVLPVAFWTWRVWESFQQAVGLAGFHSIACLRRLVRR